MTEGHLSEVEALFTKARQSEGMIPLHLPTQARWSKMDDAHKMLYLINDERSARGLHPLKDVSRRINQISQAYAAELLQYGRLTHRLNGKNSWMRLQNDSKMASCMHRIDFAENLALFGSKRGYQKFYIERAVFTWMYDDAKHDWRHRKMLLYDGFSKTDSTTSTNARIGVGVSYGKSPTFPYVVYVVLNYIDPCASWDKMDL